MTLKSALCLFLLLAGSPAATAQTKKRFCPVPPPSPYKHNGQIVTTFDPASRGMRTTLEHPRALGGATDPLYLTASFVHQDPKRAAKPTVVLAFVSASPVPKYRDSHDLVLFRDGHQWSPGVRASYQTTRGAQGETLEATSVTMSYDDLLSLTRSRKVSARLGATEFELTNNHLEALRELASLIAPPANRWRAEE